MKGYWQDRADMLADPGISPTVKRAMMRFWLESDRQEALQQTIEKLHMKQPKGDRDGGEQR